MSEAIDTLQKFFSKESNTVHYHGDDKQVKHFADALLNGTIHDYEAPDMYIEYEDEIWIIEHFEFDSFRRTRKGSSCRAEQSRIDREFDGIIATEEGVTYHGTISASSSYDDYIDNVKESFNSHYKKISQYKSNLISDDADKGDSKFLVMFLIDDISPLGTSYVDEKTGWTLIDLAHSKEFLDVMKVSSDVDFVLATACCSDEKFIWFIDREQLDEYYQNVVDYRSGRFLDFKPHVLGGKIAIPDSKLHEEFQYDQL